MSQDQKSINKTSDEKASKDPAVERGKKAIEAEKITNSDTNKDQQDKEAEKWRNEG